MDHCMAAPEDCGTGALDPTALVAILIVILIVIAIDWLTDPGRHGLR